MQATSCVRVLRTLIESGETGDLPWVLLRPRDTDDASVFDGDYDFLIDGGRFGEILNFIFLTCQKAGISFIVRQKSAFKRQIELLDPASGRVTLELWSHAEFRIRPAHGHFTRAALRYSVYDAMPRDRRASLLAALFVLHLHHKQKDPQSALVRSRLDFFLGQPGLAPELSDALGGIKTGAFDLREAHACAMAYLRAQGVPIESPWRVLMMRFRGSVRNVLTWPGLRAIAIVGPDGSGKTALINGVKRGPNARRFRFQRFKRFFRRPLVHMFRSEPRNVRDEKMLGLILPVAWLYFSLSRWLTGWARPVVLDRYFYDYFVRNVRSDSQPLQRIGAYNLCTALAPRPIRLVIASCPVEIIHRRKTEMTQASIGLLYDVYLDQVVRAGIPETLCCHTGGPLEISNSQVAHFLRPLPRL